MNRSGVHHVRKGMTTRSRATFSLIALIAALAALVATMPGASSATPVTNVTIGGFAFNPGAATASLGGSVSWTNQDSVGHTSTSDQGLWGSPTIAPGSHWSRHFNSAGSFPYHCAIHPEMHGTVIVRPRVSSISHGGIVTWAVSAGRFDVQIQRPGSHRWVAYRTATMARAATFRSTHTGRYLFRARTRGGSIASGWSPSVVVSVR